MSNTLVREQIPYDLNFVNVTGDLKTIPAAELTLLSLTEVLGGVFWVWLPIFGINEVPSLTVIIGGAIITIAVIYHGYSSSKKREPVLP